MKPFESNRIYFAYHNRNILGDAQNFNVEVVQYEIF